MLTSGRWFGFFEEIIAKRFVVVSMIGARWVIVKGRERWVTFMIYGGTTKFTEWNVELLLPERGMYERTLISSFLIQFPTKLLALILFVAVDATFFLRWTFCTQWRFRSLWLIIVEGDVESLLLIDCFLVWILQKAKTNSVVSSEQSLCCGTQKILLENCSYSTMAVSVMVFGMSIYRS